jgi:hypothetical protein
MGMITWLGGDELIAADLLAGPFLSLGCTPPKDLMGIRITASVYVITYTRNWPDPLKRCFSTFL